MKQIQELIKATQVLRVEGNSDTRVSRLAYDSRRIAPRDCFFAVSGTQSDGHAYIDAAVAAGAVAVVCQRLPEHLAPSGAIQSSGTFFSRFATFWTSTASVMHW